MPIVSSEKVAYVIDMCMNLCRFEEEQLKEVVIGATFKGFQVILSKKYGISALKCWRGINLGGLVVKT